MFQDLVTILMLPSRV